MTIVFIQAHQRRQLLVVAYLFPFLELHGRAARYCADVSVVTATIGFISRRDSADHAITLAILVVINALMLILASFSFRFHLRRFRSAFSAPLS